MERASRILACYETHVTRSHADSNWFEISPGNKRSTNPTRLRAVSGTQGFAVEKLGSSACRSEVCGRDHPHTRAHRSYGLPAALRCPGIQRAGIRHARYCRPCANPIAGRSASARGGGTLSKQASVIEAPASTPAVHARSCDSSLGVATAGSIRRTIRTVQNFGLSPDAGGTHPRIFLCALHRKRRSDGEDGFVHG